MRTLLLLLPWFGGCTATLLPVAECESNRACQDVFGYGAVCGAEGLCETTPIHARCNASEPANLVLPAPKDEVHLIATLFGRSDAHIARYRAAELAVKQANADGTFDRPFAVLHCSYDPNPADELDAAGAVGELSRWLAEDLGVSAIVGPAASSLVTIAYAGSSAPSGTLVVSPSATSVDLTNIDGTTSSDENPGLFWRTAPPDDGQAAAIVSDMRQVFDPEGLTAFRRQRTDDLAILYQTGSYGEGLATDVAGRLDAAGGSASLFPFGDDGTLAAQIAAATTGSHDEVLLISSDGEDYAFFLSGASGNAWYADRPVFFSDGGRTTDVLGPTGASLFPNIRGSVPALPEGVVFSAFDASFRGAFQIGAADHSFVAHTYDAAWLVIYAHAWAQYNEGGATEGIHLARGFRKVSNGPAVAIQQSTVSTVTANFQNGNGVNLEGASGPLDFDPNTGELPARIEIFTVNAAGTNFSREYIYGE